MRNFGRKLEVLAGGRLFGSDSLDIDVTVEKDSSPEPNTAQIDIWNPSETTAEEILGLSENALIEITAGLDRNKSLVFRGSPAPGGINSVNEATDEMLQVEALDGNDAYRATRVNRTIQGSVSGREIIQFLAGEMDVPIRQISIPNNIEMSYGEVLTGSARKNMDRITDSLSVQWSLQEEELVVVPENETSGRTVSAFSSEKGTLISTAKTNDGVEAQVLMINPVSPTDGYKLRSKNHPGFYRCSKATYSLSSYANGWTQTLRGSRL